MKINCIRLLCLCICLCVYLTACSSVTSRRSKLADVAVSAWQTTKDETEVLASKSGIMFTEDDGSSNPLTINIDETQTYQEIDGFGASITEFSADLIYNKLSEEERNELMKELFDPVDGLGISFLRQPIGGPDFVTDFDRKNDYTYDDMPPGQTDPTLSKFSIEHDMSIIIPLLRQALKHNPDIRIWATPWTPPAWMKTNDSLTNGGDLIPAYYGVYANYFVKFIQAYNGQGIPIHYVSAQNEPKNSGNFPSMIMSASSQNEFVKNYLVPAIEEAGLSTKVAVYDNDWSDIEYPSSILRDPDTLPKVAGSAWHWYSGSPEAMGVIHRLYPHKGIWITEASGGLPCNGFPINQEASWGDVFHDTFEYLIIRGMQNWAKGVVFWNLALPPPDNSNRGIVSIDYENGNVTRQTQEYCIMGHTAKHIKPGALRIGASSFGQGSIMDVAFKNTDGSRVLLVLNDAPDTQTFKVKWGRQAFDYTIPAGAVVTFKWQGTPGYASFDSPEGQIRMELYSAKSGVDLLNDSPDIGGGAYAGNIDDNDFICFDNIDFGTGVESAQLRFMSNNTGKSNAVEFRLDSKSGPLVGVYNTGYTGENSKWITANIQLVGQKISGKHDLYLVGKGGRNIGNINWVKFSRGAGDKSGWEAWSSGPEKSKSVYLALDGDEETLWRSNKPQSSGQYFMVDFGQLLTINNIVLNTGSRWADNFPESYDVFVSKDGENWGRAIASGKGDLNSTVISFEKEICRYVKIVQTGDAPDRKWAVAEFDVHLK